MKSDGTFKMSEKPSISVVVPAFNEEQGIKDAITINLKLLMRMGVDYEMVIIDDGSTDSTKKIIEKYFINLPNVKFHSKPNGGFGSAVKKGIELSTKEYVIFVPVDSPLTEDVLNSFLSHIGKADILVSYRIERKGYTPRMKFNSFVFHFLVSKLFHMSLKDYNWIHMYRRSMFDKDIEITYNGIFMQAEVLIKAKQKGYTFCEFPVEMIKRSGGVATAGSYKAAFKTTLDLFDFFIKNEYDHSGRNNKS